MVLMVTKIRSSLSDLLMVLQGPRGTLAGRWCIPSPHIFRAEPARLAHPLPYILPASAARHPQAGVLGLRPEIRRKSDRRRSDSEKPPWPGPCHQWQQSGDSGLPPAARQPGPADGRHRQGSVQHEAPDSSESRNRSSTRTSRTVQVSGSCGLAGQGPSPSHCGSAGARARLCLSPVLRGRARGSETVSRWRVLCSVHWALMDMFLPVTHCASQDSCVYDTRIILCAFLFRPGEYVSQESHWPQR